MGIRSLLVVATGILLAGASAYATREYLSPGAAVASAPAKQPMATVVIATSEIPFGQPIVPQVLRSISWPIDAVPPGAFRDMSGLLPGKDQQPRRATHDIVEGEIVLASKVSTYGEKVTIVQTLGPNQRAMAIKVEADTAVGGFVTPGDFVDIVLTQGRDAELRAVTILQNIRVLGVDQDADQARDQPGVARTVTVEVTPQQGQVLALAQQAGTLRLSLRTLDSAQNADLGAVVLGDILQQAPAPAPEPAVAPAPEPAPAPPPVQRIKVRRANQLEIVEVD